MGANTDNGSFDRIRLQQGTNNVFEFEDLAGAQSDMDFDDIAIKLNDFAIV